MPIKFRADEVISNIDRIKTDMVSELKARQGGIAQELKKTLQQRMSYEFQTVPSYLFESQVLKLPGRKEYPPGTQATFARSSPSIKGTKWEKSAQLYADSDQHLLRDLLETSTHEENGVIISEIGYPEGTAEPGSPTEYIGAVFFGNPKMQPRPILPLALKEVQEKAVRAVLSGINKVLGTLGRGFTPTKQPTLSDTAKVLRDTGFLPRKD